MKKPIITASISTCIGFEFTRSVKKFTLPKPCGYVVRINGPVPEFKDIDCSTVKQMEAGIKIIDALIPVKCGGKVGIFGGAGVEKTLLLMECI